MMRDRPYREYNDSSEERNAPVNQGDEMEVTIEAVGEKGDGLAKKDGFVLFVPNTKQGDRVRIKITRVLKKVGFAEVIGQATGAAPAHKQSRAEEKPREDSEETSGSFEDSEDFGEEEEEK